MATTLSVVLSIGAFAMASFAERLPGEAAPTSCTNSGGAFVQIRASSGTRLGEAQCTGDDVDPWATGAYVECCDGLEKQLGQWPGSGWSYRCHQTPNDEVGCTGDDVDPWATGAYVKCCDGLEKQLGQWSGSGWSYRCHQDPSHPPAAPPPPSAAPVATRPPLAAPVPAPPGTRVPITLLEWNVYYKNKNARSIADVVRGTGPDIVGLCEWTGSLDDMAQALSQAMSRPFRVQPGRGGWQGYGTDIFYDSEKWEALEGGAARAECGSRGGPRAANWVVLKSRQTGRKLITGGLHTSYCSGGCDGLHECELGYLYSKFEDMKHRHRDAVVVWMGDTNRGVSTRIMQNILQGRIGGRQVFRSDDLAQTRGNTHYRGGSAIDFIMGEEAAFERKRGGRTGQGTTGRLLNGADHFPIYAEVDLV